MAELAADALIDAELVDHGRFEEATVIISEEIFARLCLLDNPPIEPTGRPASDT